MEGSPLRPLPTRPGAPAEPGAATAFVEESLPSLDPEAATALALVDLAGCALEEAAAEAAIDVPLLTAALARGRKALRRSQEALAGSGWCERAERLISERLDADLEPPDPERLAAHMRNCPRCVEHERRLVQAIDSLSAAFAARHEQATPAEPPAPEPAPPRLELVVPPTALPPPAEPAAALEARPLAARLSLVDPAETIPPPRVVPGGPPPVAGTEAEDLEPAAAEPGAVVRLPIPVNRVPAVPVPPVAEPEPEPVPDPEPDAVEPDPEPALAPAPAAIPFAAVPRPSVWGTVAALSWHVLLALAVLLAAATVALSAYGISGGSL